MSFFDKLKSGLDKRKYTFIFIWTAIIFSMLNDHYMYERRLMRLNMEYIFDYIYQVFVVMAMVAFLYERYVKEKNERNPQFPIWRANILNALFSVVLIIILLYLYNHETWGFGIYAFLMPVLGMVYAFAVMLELVYLGYSSNKSRKAFVIRLLISIVCAILGIMATAIVYDVFTVIESHFTEVGIHNDWAVRIWIFGIVLPGFILGVEWDN